MHKAYKVAFNKLRGTMMAVNEVTGSHQVDKKAAVALVAMTGMCTISAASADELSITEPCTGDYTLNADTVLIDYFT